MKKLFLVLMLSVYFIPFGFSQDEVTSSLLWEVTGKKVESPSYIFGTMHLIPKDDFYFPEALQTYVKSTDMLVMEIGGMAEQAKGMRVMMLDTGNVFDFFNESQLDSLFAYANENLGYDEKKMRLVFGKMKPFVLLQLLTVQQFGESPESYELALEKIAKAEGMKVEGLETVEQQIGFIDNLSIDQQVSMVMDAINTSEEDDSSRKLIEAYLSQDLNKIQTFILESGMSSSEIEEHLLVSRNKNWIKPISKIIKKNKAFIAVGAAHLGGEDGVIELLRKKGYTLTPIKF